MTDHVLVDRPHPHLSVIRFNRPEKKNAITREMYRTMTAALSDGASDKDIRAFVFLGTEGCFSAGNDMADFMAAATSGQSVALDAFDFLTALSSSEKPILSGVDGLAIGIGTTIHLHCDLTIASARSLFRTPFTDLGLVPEAASSLLGPQVMGHQRAFAMFAAGEGFSGAEAHQAGLIYRLAEPEAVESETLALAARIAAKPPEAMRLSRALLRKGRGDVAGRIAEEGKLFTERLQSPEAMAAFAAFFARK